MILFSNGGSNVCLSQQPADRITVGTIDDLAFLRRKSEQERRPSCLARLFHQRGHVGRRRHPLCGVPRGRGRADGRGSLVRRLATGDLTFSTGLASEPNYRF